MSVPGRTESERAAEGTTCLCWGTSMSPTVAPGTLFEVRSEVSPRPGDAVAFAGESAQVLHRLIFKLPLLPYFTHRGDAPEARVGLARWDAILGVADVPRRKVTWHERRRGIALIARRAPTALASRLTRR